MVFTGYSGVTLSFENGAFGTIEIAARRYTDTTHVWKCSVPKG
jgi:hypothetical protein